MIKSLYIDNFKALNDFTIHFQPLTLLIGANSVGKSTVLQALELLAYFTKGKEHGELNNYLKQEGWQAKDLKSTLSQKRHTTFRLTLEVDNIDYEWTIILEAKRERYELIRESIKDHKVIILLRTKGISAAVNQKEDTLPLIDISFVSSGLSMLDEQTHQAMFPELVALKKVLHGLALFDFSATDRLKSSNFLNQNIQVGKKGENLAAYLYQLPKQDLEKLTKALQVYVPFFESIRIRKKRREEIEIDVKEKFSNKYVDALHLSDGMMRLLAILALALTESGYQTLMIEEIEDGINPNLAGEVIQTLLKVTENTNLQFILTTHNPLILDWTPVESIHLLYRNKDGLTQQKRFSEIPKVKENLDYMNPGEIWINFENEELIAD